jgi:hypothetical protein
MTNRIQLRTAVLGLAITALGAAVANAEQARRAEGAGKAEVVSGAQIAIDPATGKLRPPTVEEARELARQFGVVVGAPDRQPIAVRKLAGGMLAATLGEEYMDYSVAHLDAAGAVVLGCVGHAEVGTWLSPLAPVAPVLEEK